MSAERPGRAARARWGAALAVVLVGAGAAYAAWAQPAIELAHRDRYLGVPLGGGPIDTGAIPVGLSAVDAASCGACHVAQHAEWERSMHRVAYTNPVFQAEFGERRRPFCAQCHAPRPEAAHDGVDCASCHVREGAVLNPTVSGRAPHVSRLAPALAGSLACARCHEFEFEGQPGELLQRTMSEWAASAAGEDGQTCQSCHMPAEGRRHRHDAPGSRDPSMRERALRVDGSARVERGRTRVTLRLSVDRAGHAVPTGDMFRRLEVRAWPEGRPEAAASTWLGRRFRIDRRGWHETLDTRVPQRGERQVDLELERATRVEWSVDLWLLTRSDAVRASLPLDEVRLRLSSGSFDVE